MRVLVTGGTGYLGQRDRARAGGARTRAGRVRAPRLGRRGCRAARSTATCATATALIAAARGCDAMCHTAALVSVWRRDAREFDAVNVGGLEHAIAAARDAGSSRLVYTSSFLARPPAGHATPIRANDYQRTKVLADEVAAARARRRRADRPRCTPASSMGRGRCGRQPARPPARGSPRGPAARPDRSRTRRGRTPGSTTSPTRTWRRSSARAPGLRLRARRRERRRRCGRSRSSGSSSGGGVPRRIPTPWLPAAGATRRTARARLTGRPPRLTRGTVEIFRHDWPVDSAAAVRDLNYRVTPLVKGSECSCRALGARR